ncbi:hypothetical protein M9H77_26942 [Catharanthus roseus]|uniref:Uncharacterized protein n=1 Tax=Catharanthus roseus TaxID=4058 RepID=A0ACC0ABH5_CATRO|nr:hypothetical protein M9H77_26942 [Catharanthus roseus]
MAFTAAHRRSSPGSLSSTYRPPLSRSSRDRGTPQDRSNRGGWRGRSRSSSGRGTARQQQQLTQRERSANAWANIATTDQRGGTQFVADVETFSRARGSSNNIPNLSTKGSKFFRENNIQIQPRANSPARCSPIRQREEEPTTKTALLQGVDSPGPASRAAHHDRPSTHSPALSIPFDSEAQRAQPSTHGPADSLLANSTTQRLHPSDQLLFLDQNISTAPHPVAPNPVTFIPAAPSPSPSQFLLDSKILIVMLYGRLLYRIPLLLPHPLRTSQVRPFTL